MSFEYYGPVLHGNYSLFRNITEFPRQRKENCNLGFIEWENSNCWLDYVVLILTSVYNKDLSPSKWKVDKTSEEDVKLEQALLRLRDRLKNGEKGKFSREVKALLGRDFPKNDKWCDSYELILHILDRLNIGTLDDKKVVTYSFESCFVREMNIESGSGKDEGFKPLIGSISEYVKSSMIREYKKLYALVLLLRGHYYSYFICKGNWVFYNDLRNGYNNFANDIEFYNHIESLFGNKWVSVDLFYTNPRNLERNAIILDEEDD